MMGTVPMIYRKISYIFLPACREFHFIICAAGLQNHPENLPSKTMNLAFVNTSETVDRTEKSFDTHFLLIISYLLSALFYFNFILGEDFAVVVGLYLPNFFNAALGKVRF